MPMSRPIGVRMTNVDIILIDMGYEAMKLETIGRRRLYAIIRIDIPTSIEEFLKPENLWLKILPAPELIRREVSTVATA